MPGQVGTGEGSAVLNGGWLTGHSAVDQEIRGDAIEEFRKELDTCPNLSLDRDMQRILAPAMVSLRSLREAKGLDSRQLAELIRKEGVRVHPDHLLNVELGHKRASAPLLAAWARALGIRPTEIHQAKEIEQLLGLRKVA